MSIGSTASGGSSSSSTKYAATGGNVTLTLDTPTALTGLAVNLAVGRQEVTFHLALKNITYWTYMSWTGANNLCICYPEGSNALTSPANATPASGDFMTQIDTAVGDFTYGVSIKFDINVTTAGTYTLTLTKKGSGNGLLYGTGSYVEVSPTSF